MEGTGTCWTSHVSFFDIIQSEESDTSLPNAFHNQLHHQWRDFMIHQTTTATTARTAIQDKHPSLFDSLFCRTAASSPFSRQRASISARVFCCSSDSFTTSPPLHLGAASPPTRTESETGIRNERFEPRSVDYLKLPLVHKGSCCRYAHAAQRCGSATPCH